MLSVCGKKLRFNKPRLGWLGMGIVFLQGCAEEKLKTEALQPFKKPVIVYSFQAGKGKPQAYFQVDGIAPSHPLFFGKFSFSDTIHIGPDKKHTFPEKDFLVEYSPNQIADSLDFNGLELVPDYDHELFYNEAAQHATWRYDTIFAYYPVYLVNSTNSNKLFFGKAHHGYGIQEAVDTSRSGQGWSPIEFKAIGLECGNGSWALIVKPGEFVMLLMRKYRGGLKTKARVRIANGATVYVSKPFSASVNPAQFKLNAQTKAYLLPIADGDFSGYVYGASTRNLLQPKK